jgi:hypothetical protein
VITTIKTKPVAVAGWDRTFRGYWEIIVLVDDQPHWVTLKYPISAAEALAPGAEIEIEMDRGIACFVAFEGGAK